MLTYDKLTPGQQVQALEKALNGLLKLILEGSLRFNDKLNNDDLQARIDAACAKAESMQTPWFAGEYILDTCREDLESIAQVNAEDAIYLQDNETAVRL